MNNEIDGLKEVCESVQIVRNGEQDIATIEKQIADKMRTITAKIFDGTTKYRMPKQNMDYNGNLTVWGFAVCLEDKVYFQNDFYGDWTGLRVTTDGCIVVVIQTVRGTNTYDFTKGNWTLGCENAPRKATDAEIAQHAGELAKELLEALKTRIDTMKIDKVMLQKVAQAIL
jgi:hypothetical protein